MSNEAQKIYNDIRYARLLIHAHADDGHSTVAVGTHLDSGKSVYLHGEDHLRQIADSFDSPAQALTVLERLHAATMRPGPALTDTEREAARARTSLGTPPAPPPPNRRACPPTPPMPATTKPPSTVSSPTTATGSDTTPGRTAPVSRPTNH
ncbi:hypothetical protein [Streptomyces sp. SID13726]|uniref:hypothetical protein n=1 Tax=Streptomyces sp. SID13726 TaxID=2706058 RepID=UPI001EF1CCE7|nr:hypothetical protein [Streptomyces sp. SID13726]